MKPIVLFLFMLSPFLNHYKEVDYLELLDKSIYCEQANIRMEVYKDNKEMKFYEMEFYRLNEKMRMEFTAPATEKGRRMLNDHSSLWMYLPRTSKVMKLPFKQSFMGSDASNSDLMRMTFKKDYEITNASKKESNRIELELKAKDREVSYNKVLITFDTEKKVPVKQEMYSLSNKLIKTLLYDKVVSVDGEYIPSELTIHDELQSNSSTKLSYTNIKKKGNKPTEFFTLGSLKK
ncbi:MAG: outer membrane lipoprotein-sorting protein [Candidatus Azobacteroides sp.]|nr:outer membrane lipoprotein-sorting protein [Candidatus Azobacteroides sp.]